MAVLDNSAVRNAGVTPLARLARAAGMLLQPWRNRGAFGRLRDMSDWELADIGLDRDDLRTAWARRAEIDPTHYLGMTARTRGALEDAARRVS
jgi:uncharacterized protein YjiS (DUF1127 family)